MTDRARDAIVVGGGIVGCLTAFLLAREGLKVTLLEADSVGSHASGFAFGEMGALEGTGIPDPLLDFSVWSLLRHHKLSQEFKEASGVDNQFQFTNRLTLAFDTESVCELKKNLAWQQKVDAFTVTWLEPEDVVKAEPMASPLSMGGVHVQNAASVEPYRHTLAAAQSAEKYGAEIMQRRVTGLLAQGQNCTGVTFDGGRIEAGMVVLAMGPWTGQASAWCGLDIPVSPLKGQILRLENDAGPIKTSLYWSGSYVVTKPDGLTWAGTTEEEVGFDEETTLQARDSIMADVLKMAPGLTEARLVQHTACLRPLASDGLPIVGAAPGWQNLYIGTGAGRKGILWSTGMSFGLADLILRGQTEVPGIEHLNPGRFVRD
ncbi:MAG: hypothetical protein BZY87_04000 [SAR202 cluster bacterium Io17-Chloro-G6]|nr:MAG: hypothetical protein BZY87_04000 [SAR202 cluster bacterium Io17-Chloro-G6]